jgi:hypothetical protein
VVVPYPQALTMAADINRDLCRTFEVMRARLNQDDGTVSEWKRRISAWRKKVRGTGGLN